MASEKKASKKSARKGVGSKASKSGAGADASVDATADEDASLSFEGALEQLEETVERLEEGEMPLEEALLLFESGVKLSRQCTNTLDAAEKRIEILIADRAEGSAFQVEPFDADDEFEDEED